MVYVYAGRERFSPQRNAAWLVNKSTTRMLVVKGEVKAKIKISPVVVFGVLSRMVLVRGS